MQNRNQTFKALVSLAIVVALSLTAVSVSAKSKSAKKNLKTTDVTALLVGYTPIPTPTITNTPVVVSCDSRFINTDCGYAFTCPKTITLTYLPNCSVKIDMPIRSSHTNLASKWVILSVADISPDQPWPPKVGNDEVILNGGSSLKGTRTINNHVFYIYDVSDAAMMQARRYIDYLTRIGTKQYAFKLRLHSGNPIAYDPPLPGYDAKRETMDFFQILRTFVLTK